MFLLQFEVGDDEGIKVWEDFSVEDECLFQSLAHFCGFVLQHIYQLHELKMTQDKLLVIPQLLLMPSAVLLFFSI